MPGERRWSNGRAIFPIVHLWLEWSRSEKAERSLPEARSAEVQRGARMPGQRRAGKLVLYKWKWSATASKCPPSSKTLPKSGLEPDSYTDQSQPLYQLSQILIFVLLLRLYNFEFVFTVVKSWSTMPSYQKLQCRLSAPYIFVACDRGLQRKKINTDDHLSMCSCSGGTELHKAVKFRISRSAWCTFSRGEQIRGYVHRENEHRGAHFRGWCTNSLANLCAGARLRGGNEYAVTPAVKSSIFVGAEREEMIRNDPDKSEFTIGHTIARFQSDGKVAVVRDKL